MRYHSERPATDISRLTQLARGAQTGVDGAPARMARETLCAALRSPDLLTRILAADSLYEVGDSTCVEPLLGVLGDDEALVRKAALRALGRIGDADREALAAALQDPVDAVRVAAAEALANLNDRRAVPQLCAALQDPCPDVVAAAATTLGRFGTPEAVKPLCSALSRSVRSLPDFVYGRPDAAWTWEERSLMERRNAALVKMVRALTEIGAPEAAGALCELIGESFWRNVAVAAAESLEQLLPRLSTPQLAAALPVLKNQLPPWTLESREHRETFRRVLRAVQTRHRELAHLPLPSHAALNPTASLPRPAPPSDARPETLPRVDETMSR